MEKNLFAVKASVRYEYDEIISLWTNEDDAKRELKNVRRTKDAEWADRFYVAKVQLNNRELYI
jgi:hypothetical protein